MKKTFLFFYFFIFLFFGVNLNATNGILLGVDIGAKLNDREFINALGAEKIQTKSDIGIDLGVRIGYQHYFLDFIGIRSHISGNNVSMKKTTSSLQAGGNNSTVKSEGLTSYNGYSFSGNVDLLLKYDFTPAFGLGVYGGIGYEITFFDDEKVNIISVDQGSIEHIGDIKNMEGKGFIYNVGIQAIIVNNHQIELSYKWAQYDIESTSITGTRQGTSIKTGKSKVPIGSSFYIGYRYVFSI